jgi:hypothetical protein
MNIIYKISYLKHIKNNTPPFYYIGSKYNYKGKYYGSPSSKQKDWYTGNLSIKDWWKSEIKNDPENFLFEIIQIFPNDITPKMLVEEEKKIHLKFNVLKNNVFFNKSIATTGWVSVPRTDETKDLLSKITREYWKQDTEEVKLRKEKIIQYNNSESSEKIKKTRLSNPDKFIMTEDKKLKLSIKIKENWNNGVYDLRKKREERKISIKGKVYENAKEASKELKIHPVNIRRRCRMKKYFDWFYLE